MIYNIYDKKFEEFTKMFVEYYMVKTENYIISVRGEEITTAERFVVIST